MVAKARWERFSRLCHSDNSGDIRRFGLRRAGSQRGQSMLEILIVIALVVTLATLGAELIVTSLRSNKITSERDVGLRTAEEMFEGISAAATEDFENVYNLTKGTTQHRVVQSMGKWVIEVGTQDVSLNGITYTRYFTVQNICRATGTRDITGITDSSGADATCMTSGGGHDPSTQRITAFVEWSSGETLVSYEYISRWRNKLCKQTTWSTVGSGPDDCPTTEYESSTNVTFPGGGASIELQ